MSIWLCAAFWCFSSASFLDQVDVPVRFQRPSAIAERLRLLNFTWDSEGHMLMGTDTSAFPNKVDTHEVDGDGRRMRAKWANAADWTNFVYDELEGAYPAILAEYTLISGAFTIKSLNTHGLGVINTNREDGLGSAWALTDGSEVVQDTYTWSAFGIQEAATGSSVNPFRYVGQFGYYDDTARGSTLGLRCLGVRYYSPSLGRFISLDPVRDGDNAYTYAGQSPVLYADPSGERQAQSGAIVFGPAGVAAAIIITIGLWWWYSDQPRPIPIPLPSPRPVPAPRPMPRPKPKPEPLLPPPPWNEHCWDHYHKCLDAPTRKGKPWWVSECGECFQECMREGRWPAGKRKCQYWKNP